MAECEFKNGCIFFNDRMSSMPSMAELMKNIYCTEDPGQCARHMVAISCGRGTVPEDLYPMQTTEAESFIQGRKRSS